LISEISIEGCERGDGQKTEDGGQRTEIRKEKREDRKEGIRERLGD
jgi:hypothetical protein